MQGWWGTAARHRAGAFVEPGAQGLHTVSPERRRSLLASLARASNMHAGNEHNIAAGQVD